MGEVKRAIGAYDVDMLGLAELPYRAPEIVGKLTMRDTILSQFNAHEGYNPGTQLIRLYEPGSGFKECCSEPDGTGTFSEVMTDIVCLSKGNRFCEQDLARALNDLNFRFTAGNEALPAPLINLFMDQENAQTAIDIDKLVFQGDIALSGTDEVRGWADGLIKLADTSADTTKLMITGGNVYTAIQQIIMCIPLAAYDGGNVTIMVGRDVAMALQASLIAMNQYNYNPGARDVYEPISFPGFSNVNILPARGLDGTNRIIATQLENIHWFTNLSSDYLTVDFDYSKYHQRWFWIMKFIYGINYANYEHVTIASITNDVLSASPTVPVTITNELINTAVVAPLGANGGVLTDTNA